METFLDHVVATINDRSKRREEEKQRERQQTQPVLDDVATIAETRKASAPAATNDRKQSSSAGHWLESCEFDALPPSLQEVTKKRKGTSPTAAATAAAPPGGGGGGGGGRQ